jgi:HPr kinase/phosphorylase
MRSVRVEDLLTEGERRLGLQPLAGLGGLGRVISSSKLQRPGRELGREASQIRANRLLIFGKSEMELLDRLSPSRRNALYRDLSLLDLPCIILEGAVPFPEELRSFAQVHSIPLLVTPWQGLRLSRLLHEILKALLGPEIHIQGVLLRVLDVGVLILGKSGIGKSECALDLISRGHALVADDLVELRRGDSGRVLGTSPELIRHHMEVRGLGIINIQELFGPAAVELESPVDLVVELLEWQQFQSLDRTGLTQRRYTLLEADIPLLRIPVSLNRNVAIILEVAVRNHLLRQKGVRPLERLEQRIESQLRTRART